MIRTLLALLLLCAPAAAQVVTGPPITAGGTVSGATTFQQHVTTNGLDIIAKVAASARYNNPRVNPVMTFPPAITSTGSHNGTLTNITTPTTVASGVGAGAAAMNFYGGAQISDGAGCFKFVSTTVSSALVQYVWRMETLADAAKVEIEVIDVSNSGRVNFIIDGRYVSYTVFNPNVSGVSFITLDFTLNGAGGRAPHDIIIEGQNTDFCQIAVGPTETISKPAGTVVRAVDVGDSMTASGGMLWNFMGYAQILPDMLGIRDIWNLGVGGTGLIATGGQLTCPARLSDIVAAAPNIIFLTCGRNDTVSSPAAVTAAMTAWLVAIRAQATLAKVPIVVWIPFTNTALATSQPTETAIQAAVTAFNDPLVIMIPNVNAAAGPAFTGIGCQGATTGSGNSDIYVHSDCVHPGGQTYGSPAAPTGHWFLANWIANAMMKQAFLP